MKFDRDSEMEKMINALQKECTEAIERGETVAIYGDSGYFLNKVGEKVRLRGDPGEFSQVMEERLDGEYLNCPATEMLDMIFATLSTDSEPGQFYIWKVLTGEEADTELKAAIDSGWLSE